MVRKALFLVPLLCVGSGALAQDGVSPAKPPKGLLADTISCSDFERDRNGTWYPRYETNFRIGEASIELPRHQQICPGCGYLGWDDLYARLERKCGSNASG